MTFRSSERELVNAVGKRLERALARKSVKEVQDFAGGISHPTASYYRRGELPDVFAPFFGILRRLGPSGADVMGPVFGDLNPLENVSRLQTMAASLKELAKDVEAISRANAQGRDSIRAVLGFGPSPRAGVAAEPAGMGRDLRGVLADEAGPIDPTVAVAAVRRPIEDVHGPGRENLIRQIADWQARGGRSSCDDAITYAKADPLKRLGVAIRRPGASWELAHLAEDHPMHGLPVDPKRMAAEFDRTAAEPGAPWLLDTAALFLKRGSLIATANWVCRTVDRASDGTLILTAGFAPKVTT